MKILKDLFKEKGGQALTDFGLIIGLLAVLVIGSLFAVGIEVDATLGKIKSDLVNTVPEDELPADVEEEIPKDGQDDTPGNGSNNGNDGNSGNNGNGGNGNGNGGK